MVAMGVLRGSPRSSLRNRPAGRLPLCREGSAESGAHATRGLSLPEAGSERPMAGQDLRELLGQQGPGEVVSLAVVAAERPKVGQLIGTLYSLGHGAQPQAVDHGHDAAGERPRGLAGADLRDE